MKSVVISTVKKQTRDLGLKCASQLYTPCSFSKSLTYSLCWDLHKIETMFSMAGEAIPDKNNDRIVDWIVVCLFFFSYKWPEIGTSGSHLNFLQDNYAALISCKISFLGKFLFKGLCNDSFCHRKFYTLASRLMLEELEGSHGGALC